MVRWSGLTRWMQALPIFLPLEILMGTNAWTLLVLVMKMAYAATTWLLVKLTGSYQIQPRALEDLGRGATILYAVQPPQIWMVTEEMKLCIPSTTYFFAWARRLMEPKVKFAGRWNCRR